MKKKIEICERVLDNRRKKTGTLKGVAKMEGIDPSALRRWIKKLPELKQASCQSKFTLHEGGRTSFKHPVQLVQWVLELRNQGMPVSMGMVILKTSQMDANFRRKTPTAKYSIIRRLLRSNNIRIRAKTHESQRAPKEVMEEAKAFAQSVSPRVNGPNRDKRFILNMDQTPVFFSMTSNTTLEKKGARTVNVRSSSGSTMRITVAVTVTAAGGTLPPLIVFKGTPKGRIARDFVNAIANGYPAGCFYACQARAWMDEEVMLQWVDKILKPYVEIAPPGIVPLLFLDKYKCHMMASVVNKIQNLGCEVEHIPGGCTGLTQPVDVGCNKPLKNRIRHQWEEYMLEDGLLHNKSKPPTRQQLAQWCCNSLNELEEGIVKNAWLHGEYSFFPADVAARSSQAARSSPVVPPVVPYEQNDNDEMFDSDEEDEMMAMV